MEKRWRNRWGREDGEPTSFSPCPSAVFVGHFLTLAPTHSWHSPHLLVPEPPPPPPTPDFCTVWFSRRLSRDAEPDNLLARPLEPEGWYTSPGPGVGGTVQVLKLRHNLLAMWPWCSFPRPPSPPPPVPRPPPPVFLVLFSFINARERFSQKTLIFGKRGGGGRGRGIFRPVGPSCKAQGGS